MYNQNTEFRPGQNVPRHGDHGRKQRPMVALEAIRRGAPVSGTGKPSASSDRKKKKAVATA